MSESAQPVASASVDASVDGSEAHSGDLLILLEQQLEHLVSRHRESRKTIAELKDVIVERERQIQRLEQRLNDAEALRGTAVSRIDGLIEKIDAFEREAAHAAAEDANA